MVFVLLTIGSVIMYVRSIKKEKNALKIEKVEEI